MSKHRVAAKIDENQPEIVRQLKKAGCAVALNHDDILVSKDGVDLWVEIKSMDTWLKCGGLKAGTFKDSQIDLLKTWKGNYMVAWNAEQILSELNRLIRK